MQSQIYCKLFVGPIQLKGLSSIKVKGNSALSKWAKKRGLDVARGQFTEVMMMTLFSKYLGKEKIV